MRGRVVTVFGGAGFIGRHLVRRLAERGAVVRVVARRPEAVGHLKPMGEVGQIVVARFTDDPDSLAKLVGGAHAVVNLVGILYESRAGDFDRMHGELPGRIGAAATASGVERLVHVSAIGADASSPSHYARSKAAGEVAVREAFPAATILRPSIVFGPEDGFFNRFASMARLSPALPLIGGGRTRFQPVYVGDVADAVMACLERAEHAGQTFELAGPKVYTFEDLLTYMLRVLGRRRILVGLPFALARLQARFLEMLPAPLLTRDQVELLRRDNVASPDAPGLAALGIEPTPLEVIVPTYLRPYARLGAALPVV